MAAPTPVPGFHDAAVIDALEPKAWLELFKAYGAPPGLNADGATLEHIADRLAVSGLPESLQRVLEWLYSLGSPDGCERISSVAREFNVDLRTLKGIEPGEFVARVALMATANPNVRTALDRAQTSALIAAHPASRVHEFRGRVARTLVNPETRLEELRSGLVPLLDGEDLGERVDVSLRQEGEVTRVIIVRGKRLHAPVSFTESGRRRLPHRPVQCDLLVYDANANTVSIHTSAWLVEGYRRVAGEVFWGDPEYLVPSRCSLEPLKEGRIVLERHGSPDVRSIELTYAKFRPHEGGTCEYSGRDVFELMARMKVPMADGNFVAARFQFGFYGPGRRPMTVEVNPPTVKAADNNRQRVVLSALQNIGIWRVVSDPTGPFFWDLAAGAHLRGEWRNVISDAAAFDGLVSDRAFVNRKLASVGHVEAPGAGPVLDVVEADDDPPFYGESVDEHVPGRRLTSSEVEGLELDAPRFAAVWAGALGCTGEVRELPLRGLFLLGDSQFGNKHVHILLALREPQQEEVAKLAPTFPSPNVVVTPRPRNVVTWPMPSVRVESMVPDRQAMRRAIVREMHIESEVDARDRARPQDTLIIDVPSSTVWLHGTKIDISGAPYLFTLLVARATQANHVAAKNDLITKLAGQSGARNAAGNAKMKAERLMKAQLKAAEVPVPGAIFASKKGGYVYVGHAFVGD